MEGKGAQLLSAVPPLCRLTPCHPQAYSGDAVWESVKVVDFGFAAGLLLVLTQPAQDGEDFKLSPCGSPKILSASF